MKKKFKKSIMMPKKIYKGSVKSVEIKILKTKIKILLNSHLITVFDGSTMVTIVDVINLYLNQSKLC